ncbi:MAG: DUF177 domain-containing protein [Alphaproteobacteria bacterium]|nr:DUF177 domain-containing protein [Alphaproteobacteria bacterium]
MTKPDMPKVEMPKVEMPKAEMNQSEMEEPALEFVRDFDTATLGRAERGLELKASAAECVALARRFSLVEIRAFSASLRVVRSSRTGMIRVSGTLSADVVQECVATLEPVDALVEEDVEVKFSPKRKQSDENDKNIQSAVDLEVAFDEEDPPEPMKGDIIQLGEPLAQFLALGLDPYPQAPDRKETNWSSASPKEAAAFERDKDRENPFSVLAALKKEAE